MTRTNARELACQLVYETGFRHLTAQEALDALMQDGYYETLKDEADSFSEKPTDKQLAYITAIVQGVQARQTELEGYISRFSVGWSIDRISRVAVAIMEVCMYESLYVDDVPVGAAINEAVELTRRYEDEDVVSFVNGILGRFAREVVEQC